MEKILVHFLTKYEQKEMEALFIKLDGLVSGSMDLSFVKLLKIDLRLAELQMVSNKRYKEYQRLELINTLNDSLEMEEF
ncbi:hypothetical protein [Neobacillus sp. DY30]|uniref:hypothetical protein n=1 Tax=Neobacillus sp. DY30 TaxID=3047871 RepID=UPI0024C095B0|nr:hypothetical protein [Neobacillus sp. DY30]WHX98453.1 hypothetical protein QNH29_17545 [Neobacillus sp. DY30]